VSNRFLSLRVLADAKPHREPGTTVADPMTGAGPFTVVLAVAAIGAPRLRAGAPLSLRPPLAERRRRG